MTDAFKDAPLLDTTQMASEEERVHLHVYRAILMNLCEQMGGEIFVKCDIAPHGGIYHKGGTLMHKQEPDGVRMRFIPDTEAH